MKFNIKDSACTLSLNKAAKDDLRVVLDIDPPVEDWRPPETVYGADEEGNSIVLPPVIGTINKIEAPAIGTPAEIARRIEIELFGFGRPDVDLEEFIASILK